MSKFYGKIGFANTGEDPDEPGVWNGVTERNYYGDLIRTTKNTQGSDKVNENIVIHNELSVLVDPYAMNHFSDIVYVEFMGVKWKVMGVEIKFPRLILTTGSVYNGGQTQGTANGS